MKTSLQCNANAKPTNPKHINTWQWAYRSAQYTCTVTGGPKAKAKGIHARALRYDATHYTSKRVFTTMKEMALHAMCAHTYIQYKR